jgi:hypothetical protein
LALAIGIVCSLTFSAGEVLASEARSGRSGLAVGIFLGFCALIVVAQLLPALRSRLLARQQDAETKTVEIGGGDH